MEDKSYPKVQFSVFTGSNKDQQWVFRGETVEEVKKLKDEVMIDKQYVVDNAKTTTPMSYCPTHSVPYDKTGVGKNGKPYAMHKLADNTPCWKK